MAGYVTNLDLYMKLRSGGDLKNFLFLYEVLISSVSLEISHGDRDKILEFSRIFSKNLVRRWNDANRTEKTFMNRENNRRWLEQDINWPTCETVDLIIVLGVPERAKNQDPEFSHHDMLDVPDCSPKAGSSGNLKRGAFDDLSNRQKKRLSSNILDEYSEEALQYFLLAKMKQNGKKTFAKIIKHLSNNPAAISRVSELLFEAQKLPTVSEDKTLALCTNLALSKWQYLGLKTLFREENCANLISYQCLLKARKRCYPPEESIEVKENGARIRLQALLDHTAQRLVQSLGPVSSTNEGLQLIWKWGIDGASSQSNYKQKSSTPGFDDSSVVMISIVPLRLVDGNGLIIWENPNPSSIRYCRPVKFTFTKETATFIKTEVAEMQREISELVSTQCGDAVIAHKLHMTMIDGKVANIVADVPSSSTCPICLAKPSEMNNLGLLATKLLRQDLYQYGISSLHMKIHCMECLLHVSYNLDFERWSARGQNKVLKQARKSFTQEEFREQTGLLIDIVKQGFGTTNDGNTARRFFKDVETSSRITGIDEDLIFRFAVILQAVSSRERININSFRSYCQETAEMFVHLYPWYYMPISVHKLLIHGADICSHFANLPIGILSEEASEARNKDFRNYRQRNSRKSGRIASNEDILHGLLISSDPYISSLRPKIMKQSHNELHPDAVQLLHLDSLADDFEEEEVLAVESEIIQDPFL